MYNLFCHTVAPYVLLLSAAWVGLQQQPLWVADYTSHHALLISIPSWFPPLSAEKKVSPDLQFIVCSLTLLPGYILCSFIDT